MHHADRRHLGRHDQVAAGGGFDFFDRYAGRDLAQSQPLFCDLEQPEIGGD